jgi:hypothetical protein
MDLRFYPNICFAHFVELLQHFNHFFYFGIEIVKSNPTKNHPLNENFNYPTAYM